MHPNHAASAWESGWSFEALIRRMLDRKSQLKWRRIYLTLAAGTLWGLGEGGFFFPMMWFAIGRDCPPVGLSGSAQASRSMRSRKSLRCTGDATRFSALIAAGNCSAPGVRACFVGLMELKSIEAAMFGLRMAEPAGGLHPTAFQAEDM